MKSRSIRHLFFIILLFAFIGYLREFFFVHLNIIMFEIYYDRPGKEQYPVMDYFRRMDYETLYYLKYFFTLISAAIFFAVNFLALKFVPERSIPGKILFYIYIILFAMAGIAMLYGIIVKGRFQNDEYTLSRWLLGVAQSPLPAMALLAAQSLYQATGLKKQN